MEKVKLPGKLHAVQVITGEFAGEWLASEKESELGNSFPYIPEAEAERLRERVKQLEGALEKIIGPYELPFPQSKEDAKPLSMAAKRREYDVAVAREALGGGEGK